MKPLILLTGGTGAAANGTPTWALNQNYAENIRRAGGIPILAVNNDCAEEYADLADGLLLSGGKDVEPKLYGQEKMFDFVITDHSATIWNTRSSRPSLTAGNRSGASAAESRS